MRTVSWPKKAIDWIEDGTAYVSVPFTWNLPDAHARCAFLVAEGYQVRIGGPAVDLMPAYVGQWSLDVELGGEIDALPHHLQIGKEAGLSLREIAYWYKGDHLTGGAGDTAWGSWLSPSSPYLRQVGEPFLVWHKGNARHPGDAESDLSPDEFKSWSTNVWLIGPRHHPKHPAVFPDEFAWRCIKLYSFLDDMVVDPFVGSGTTCAVAYKLGRRTIGIDLKEEYLEMAKKRLLQGVLL